ncbi:tetratricopeptide repeat protein [Aquabacterium sp.]|uniref:tetratricopeptide repeat protein n=1 Tax=Aquabacterium sp. TaxID=1872578 RepID=UPI0037835CDD
MKKLHALAAAAMLAVAIGAAQAQAVRPEVGKPLQQASELLRAGKAKEALAKVREADAVGGKTAAEQTMIERMRGAAAQRAGDTATAIQAFEALFPKLSGADAAQVAEQLAFAFSQQKDWPRTSQWAQKAQSLGSTSPQLKQLLAYVQSQSGDYSAIAREAAAAVSAAEQAGRRPEEGDLLRLADAQQRTGNAAGQTATLDKLLTYYPKKEYWSIFLGRLPRKSGFSDRFSLDVMRLKLATGNLSKTEEFMEMAQLSLQAGYPAEGKAIIEKGFASGALGQGPEAERHKRLRDLAIKQEGESKASIEQRAKDAATAKDGNDLVQIGYAYVTMGQADKGIPLIEQGIAKGGLKRPEDAKLRLGLALLQGGKAKAKAVQTLRSVQGNDGGADLGRLWALYAQTNG